MEKRVSGYRVCGSWDDVVTHGVRITRVLREGGVAEDVLAEWDDWRSKAHEQLEDEVSEKTVETASVEKGAGEKAGRAPGEDLQRASEWTLESIETTERDDPVDILEKWENALDHALRAAYTTTRRAVRTIETAVYEQVLTRFTPCYFDNELVSANLRPTTRLEDDDAFVVEVNVNDDELNGKADQRLDRSNGTGQ